MKKQRLEKELQKTRQQIRELKEKEKNLVDTIREIEKNEAAAILEEYNISPEQLSQMLKAMDKANQMYLFAEAVNKHQNEMENES